MGLEDLLDETENIEGKLPVEISLPRQSWEILLAFEVYVPGITAEILMSADEEDVKGVINILNDELNSTNPFGYEEVPEEIKQTEERLKTILRGEDPWD